MGFWSAKEESIGGENPQPEMQMERQEIAGGAGRRKTTRKWEFEKRWLK
jgi:hypothetical protein